ncbi:MAG TPA: hypothetical protein VK559_09935 [Ferruginibacter sp.]|nr:hypothetical protein [Ferruginibacter sp.]
MTRQVFLRSKQDEIDNLILSNIKSEGEDDFYKPILDGVVDIESYNNCSPKILWVLREFNNVEGEINNLREVLSNLKTPYGIKAGYGSTYEAVIYISNGIINNQEYLDISDIKDEPDLVDVLKKIAVINIRKVANFWGTRTHFPTLDKAFLDYKHIIKKQIEDINPDIIICGGTSGYIHELGIKNKLIIQSYHPSAPHCKPDEYRNKIILQGRQQYI